MCTQWADARAKGPAPPGASMHWGCPRGAMCDFAHGEHQLRGSAQDDAASARKTAKGARAVLRPIARAVLRPLARAVLRPLARAVLRPLARAVLHPLARAVLHPLALTRRPTACARSGGAGCDGEQARCGDG